MYTRTNIYHRFINKSVIWKLSKADQVSVKGKKKRVWLNNITLEGKRSEFIINQRESGIGGGGWKKRIKEEKCEQGVEKRQKRKSVGLEIFILVV